MRQAASASVSVFLLVTVAAAPVHAEMSATELAKLAQNPLGNIINATFQNNTNFNAGPLRGTQNILNLQPVIPFALSKDWNVITRPVLPLIWQPESVPGQGDTFGLGDLQLSAFLSPSQPTSSGLVWGLGPIVQMPTDTNGLGNKNWGLGPSAVVLHLTPDSPWVAGVFAYNVWSLSSSNTGGAYNNFLVQPFVNYNLAGGYYIVSAPIITANWNAPSGQQWTVPLGLGVGNIVRLGKVPVNLQIEGFYNVVRPDDAPNWQLRLQVKLLFPK